MFDALDQTLADIAGGFEPFPSCVEIHPTDFCNQACSYCFHGGVGEDRSRREELLTVSEYCRLCDELVSLGVGEISVSGGGEPLLYRGIEEVLRHITSSHIKLRVVTNANHMSSETLQVLTLANEVRISIDSVKPDTYNFMRGLRGGNLLQRTLEHIHMLVQQRAQLRRTVKVACTFLISEPNLPEIETFSEVMIEGIGVDTVVYKSDIYGRVTSQDPLVGERLSRLRDKYGHRVEIRTELRDGPAAGPCIVPYLKVAFDPYGGLYSCCLGAQPGETNGLGFGSLRAAGSFQRLWDSAASKRTAMRTTGVSCKDCNHTDRALNNNLRQLQGRSLDTTNTDEAPRTRRLLPLVRTN
jgi:MoaA/NifB/PqqE/SkfB family radical SAM enzyme